VPLVVPPLREHAEDIPDLLKATSTTSPCTRSCRTGAFSASAQNFLRNYHWPGNVRELKNLVQRVLILGTGDEIGPRRSNRRSGPYSRQCPRKAWRAVSASTNRCAMPVMQFEKAYLEYQLDKHGGNVSKMAKEAGMERTHLYRKLRDRGIEIKDRR
jgi:two-component system nitrogen regulation response regulator NtrX